MTTGTRSGNTRWTYLLTLATVTVAGLTAIAIGAGALWQRYTGPTRASTADCELAQQLFDRAQTAPADGAQAERWEREIRQIRYTRLADEGLSTEVGRYVAWSRVRATGTGERPTAEQFDRMKDEALGHCEGSDVDLKIPAINF